MQVIAAMGAKPIKAWIDGGEFEVRLPAGALVDDEDFPLVAGISWCIGTLGYVQSSRGYMHRLLMRAQPGQIVDHINGDRKDNRRGNLRFVTCAENNANRRVLGTKSRSGFRGVSWCAQTGRWKATVKIGYRQHWVGRFTDPAEAHRAVSTYRLAHLPGATA